jgi:DNA-binding NarL/FixJ family response regulator
MTQEERIRSIEQELQVWAGKIQKLQKELDGLKKSVDSDIDENELLEVIKTAALAYSNNKVSAQELTDAMGEACYSQHPPDDNITARPVIARRLLEQSRDIAPMGTAMPLTHRETQILNCIADGNTNKEIGLILKNSEKTVKNQVSAIFRKLNANDRAHAVAIAMTNNWILAEREHEATVAVS